MDSTRMILYLTFPYCMNLSLSCGYHENYFSIKQRRKKPWNSTLQYKMYLVNNNKHVLHLYFFSSLSLSKWHQGGFMDTFYLLFFLVPFDPFRQRKANIAPSWGRQSWPGSAKVVWKQYRMAGLCHPLSRAQSPRPKPAFPAQQCVVLTLICWAAGFALSLLTGANPR